jgi:hypothetical protein
MSLAFYSPARAANCGGNVPCHCGDILTASRTLVSGIDPIVGAVCTGDGLIIDNGVDENDVILNLNGNKLVGSGGGVGVLIADDHVTIEDGGIDNFDTGIGTAGTTTGSSINAVRPNVNVGDGILLQGDGNELIGILAKRNGNNGVTVIGNDNLLQGHNDEYNGFHGIFVDGNNNELIANLASENRKTGPGNGITVEGDNNTLERNKITKMNTNGIVVGGHNNILSKNKVVKQDRDGIVVDGNDNVLTENKATGSKGVGIIVEGVGNPVDSQGNVVSQNRTNPQCSIYGVTTPNTCIVK